MNQEKIYSMITEKSISINDIPGGGFPDFTPEDARHALGHMKPCEFNYCQYVFLLYDEKYENLVDAVAFKVIEGHQGFRENIELMQTFIKICEMACLEQRKPEGKIPDTYRYNHLKITRHEWRYKWKDVYVEATNYLNELRLNVGWHIYKRTKDDI